MDSGLDNSNVFAIIFPDYDNYTLVMSEKVIFRKNTPRSLGIKVHNSKILLFF